MDVRINLPVNFESFAVHHQALDSRNIKLCEFDAALKSRRRRFNDARPQQRLGVVSKYPEKDDEHEACEQEALREFF